MHSFFSYFFKRRRSFLSLFTFLGLCFLPIQGAFAQYITRTPNTASPVDNDSEYYAPGKAGRQGSYTVPVYPTAPANPATPTAKAPAQQRYYEDFDRNYQYPTYNQEEDNPYYYTPYPVPSKNPPVAAPTPPAVPQQPPVQQPAYPYAPPVQQQRPNPASPFPVPVDVDEEYYYQYQQTNDPAYYPLYYDR